MGCSFAGKKSSIGNFVAPNPDPKKFKIKRIWSVGKFTVAMITYSGCTTYKGNKVLVYKTTEKLLFQRKEIDPHFLGKSSDPVARFPGDEQGWDTAIDFVMKVAR